MSHSLSNTAPVSATNHAALVRVSSAQGSSVARRMSDFSVSEPASAWGWESFSAAAEETTATGAAVCSILEQAQAQAPPGVAEMQLGVSSFAYEQQQGMERHLQRILQEQRLKDLMDLNRKQQNNLRIQREQLEQQRLELQLRDQEQLEQLRIELRAREQEQQQQLQLQLQLQKQPQLQQQHHFSEPLPRPPSLFKPQDQQSRVARRSSAPPQSHPPPHDWPRQQQSSSTPGSPRHQSQAARQGPGSPHQGP